MADLTVGGVSVRVRKNTWREQKSLYQGGRIRHADNSLVSTEDATTRKRVYTCEIYVITDAERTALEAAIPIGVAVTVAGDLPRATRSMLVTLQEGTTLTIINGVVQVLHDTFTLHLEEA